MHTIYSLTEAINLATKVETQLDRTQSTGVARPPFDHRQNFPMTATQRGKLPMNPPPPTSHFAKGSSSSRTQGTTTRTVPPEAPWNPYSRPLSNANRIHARWVAFIQKFTFTLKHKSGQLNKVADALNWKVSLLITMQAEVIGFKYLKELYAEDEDFGHNWNKCQQGLP
ncbi:hypothetical protein SADUNF_Sadunf16G0268700 [Salix dunnii]|uniref:Uncharacterized protein n=1 Tax=Salix dunnii TaxID=1413687 RepID=A0A835JAP1_9ROSI|nr:hypothetical protein SADUNF_Sadunf16G0268700 [Salix dunnii]